MLPFPPSLTYLIVHTMRDMYWLIFRYFKYLFANTLEYPIMPRHGGISIHKQNIVP